MDFTLHQTHKEQNPNCELCAEKIQGQKEKKKWNINAPESRVKEIPIPKGFFSAPRRGDGNHY